VFILPTNTKPERGSYNREKGSAALFITRKYAGLGLFLWIKKTGGATVSSSVPVSSSAGAPLGKTGRRWKSPLAAPLPPLNQPRLTRGEEKKKNGMKEKREIPYPNVELGAKRNWYLLV